MKGFNQYQLEIQDLLNDTKNNKYHSEIMETLSEIDEIQDLEYEKIIKIMGAPLDFINEFLNNREIKPVFKENIYLMHIVRLGNIFVFLVMTAYVFIIPFTQIRYGNYIFFSITTFQLSTQGSTPRAIFAVALMIILFIVLEYYHKIILYSPVTNLVSYFKKYIEYFFSSLLFVILIQIYVIFPALNKFANTYDWGYIAFRQCEDLYNDSCHYYYGQMWNIMQWLIVWGFAFQSVLILTTMFYRLQRNGISLTDFEQIERIEIDTSRYPSVINSLYRINVLLIILVYTPANLYLLLVDDTAYSNPAMVMILSDLLITILIVLQMILFAGLRYSFSTISTSIRKQSFSSGKHQSAQIIYIVYLISTLFPDNYYTNTDGMIVVTSIIASLAIIIIWLLEFPEKKKQILAVLPIVLILITIWDSYISTLLIK